MFSTTILRPRLPAFGLFPLLMTACGSPPDRDDSANAGGMTSSGGSFAGTWTGSAGGIPGGGPGVGGSSSCGLAGIGGTGGGSGNISGSTTSECDGTRFDWCEDFIDTDDVCDGGAQKSPTARQSVIDYCHSVYETSLPRTEPCFLAEMLKCLADKCVYQDCLHPALLAFDPSQGDAAEFQTCQDANGAECETWPRGDLAACKEKQRQCPARVSTEECVLYAALRPQYKTAADTCLTQSCSEWGTCLRDAF